MGLRLFIKNKIALKLGGRLIKLNSIVGEGSKFTVYIEDKDHLLGEKSILIVSGRNSIISESPNQDLF